MIVETYQPEISTNLPNGFRPQIIGERRSLWETETKVGVTSSDYLTGINRHSGKRWYKWTTRSAYGFYRMPNGTINAYQYARGVKGKFANHPPDVAFHNLKNEYLKVAYGAKVQEKFGITDFTDLYPLAKHYDITDYNSIPYSLIRPMREEDFKAFLAMTFGKSNLRKDLIKAAAVSNPNVLAYARHFRGLVPVDWIVNFLRLNEKDETYGRLNRSTERVRELFYSTDQRTLRNLLNQRLNINTFYTINELYPTRPGWDHLFHYENVRDQVFRNWNGIHDAVYTPPARAVRKPIEEGPIELIPLAKKLDGARAGNLRIKAADHTELMVKWSSQMNNCISSYREIARQGNGLYLGIYQDDALVGNIEIKGKTVAQMLGKYNKALDNDARTTLESLLKANNVIVPQQYWGSVAHDNNW